MGAGGGGGAYLEEDRVSLWLSVSHIAHTALLHNRQSSFTQTGANVCGLRIIDMHFLTV